MSDPTRLLGVVFYADKPKGRFAVQTELGDYTVFEASPAGDHGIIGLGSGSAVEGPLHTIGTHVLTVGKYGRIVAKIAKVKMECVAAAAWVGGTH